MSSVTANPMALVRALGAEQGGVVSRRQAYAAGLTRWPRWRLVVEVDGIQHTWVENVVGDALRQNSLAIAGDTVLRLPLLGLRLCPEEFYEQIEQALRAAGWSPPA